MLSEVGQMGRHLLLPSSSGHHCSMILSHARESCVWLQHSILTGGGTCCRNRTCQRHLQRAQAMLCQPRGRMNSACQQSHRERSSFSSQPDLFCAAGLLGSWCVLMSLYLHAQSAKTSVFAQSRPAHTSVYDCKWTKSASIPCGLRNVNNSCTPWRLLALNA